MPAIGVCGAVANRTGFNNPADCANCCGPRGRFTGEVGFVDFSHDDVVVSALKPGKDGTAVLRVYEAAGAPAHNVRVTLHTPVTQVREANLIEDAGADVHSSGDAFEFHIKPFEIKTFKLSMKPFGVAGSISQSNARSRP